MKELLNVRFVCEPQAVAAARRALDRLDGVVGPDLRDALCLLVSELVTNSIRHSGARPTDVVGLRVALSEDTVRTEVTDTGPGFEVRRRGGDPMEIGGWGLELVERLADRWGLERRRGNVVWFEIDRDRRPLATAAAGR